MPNSVAKSTPEQLSAFVLEYLSHQCYTKTARAFIKDSLIRHLDADGDEMQNLSTDIAQISHCNLTQVELREKIRAEIVAGRVDDAFHLLNEHFPSVLSGPSPEHEKPDFFDEQVMIKTEYTSPTSVDPAHLILNLRILSFIEACRTMPIEHSQQSPASQPPTTPEPEKHSLDVEEDPSSDDQRSMLLSKARKLLGSANMLTKSSDRAVYLNELNNVSGLLAYKVPERSPIAKYLGQERREAVADQVNRAILDRCASPTVSSLELLVRQTTTVWSFAHRAGVKPRPGALLPPTPFQQISSKDQEVVPSFDLHHFINSKT